MQVSITDFASLAAVAEGKVGLAGSSMKGFAVAQQVIEYSHPAKVRLGKVSSFWTLSLNVQPIIRQMPKQWCTFVHVWSRVMFCSYPLLVRHTHGTHKDLYNHKVHHVHQMPED